ncbi:hypothetical protein PHLCEN_2v6038 [Hermanssonia centrifuga]|uniref:Uncharacterized protein n=1 Tax=Hermanssonia centrifuga TaxID=98765 RepID=A0A2R6P0N8_9APHY|nr:hypothetical protein PHLCEN_2v6038 [Hermanssonia centrifuga]
MDLDKALLLGDELNSELDAVNCGLNSVYDVVDHIPETRSWLSSSPSWDEFLGSLSFLPIENAGVERWSETVSSLESFETPELAQFISIEPVYLHQQENVVSPAEETAQPPSYSPSGDLLLSNINSPLPSGSTTDSTSLPHETHGLPSDGIFSHGILNPPRNVFPKAGQESAVPYSGSTQPPRPTALHCDDSPAHGRSKFQPLRQHLMHQQGQSPTNAPIRVIPIPIGVHGASPSPSNESFISTPHLQRDGLGPQVQLGTFPNLDSTASLTTNSGSARPAHLLPAMQYYTPIRNTPAQPQQPYRPQLAPQRIRYPLHSISHNVDPLMKHGVLSTQRLDVENVVPVLPSTSNLRKVTHRAYGKLPYQVRPGSNLKPNTTRVVRQRKKSDADATSKRYLCLHRDCPEGYYLLDGKRGRDRHMDSHYNLCRYQCSGCGLMYKRKDGAGKHATKKKCSKTHSQTPKAVEIFPSVWTQLDEVHKLRHPPVDDPFHEQYLDLMQRRHRLGTELEGAR